MKVFSSTMVALLALIFVLEALRWSALVLHPMDLDYAESWHTYCSQQAYPGGKHVGNIEEPPHNILPYDPLSYLLTGLTSGYSDDFNWARSAGRANSLIMTMVSGAFIAMIARILGANGLGALLGAVLFYSAQRVQVFAVSLRPDALACALALAALFCLLKKQSAISGILLGLSLAAKHSYVIAPLIFLFFLLVRRNYRKMLILIGSISLTLGTVAIISRFFLGEYWWQGLSLQSLSHANFKQALSFISYLLEGGAASIPFYIGLGSLLIFKTSREFKMASLYFGLSLCVHTLASAKQGAWTNYFLEPLALGSILTAVAFTAFPKNIPLRYHAPGYLVLLTALCALFAQNGASTSKYLKNRPKDNHEIINICSLLRSVKGPILATISEMYFQSGHEHWASPADFINLAESSSKVDMSGFIERIKTKKFGAIVVKTNWKERPFFPLKYMEIVQKQYVDHGIIDGYQVFLSPRILASKNE